MQDFLAQPTSTDLQNASSFLGGSLNSAIYPGALQTNLQTAVSEDIHVESGYMILAQADGLLTPTLPTGTCRRSGLFWRTLPVTAPDYVAGPHGFWPNQ
jgi:hypothetical protein